MAKHPRFSILISILLFGALTGLQAQTYLKASLNIPANAGILSESCGGPYELVLERGEDNAESTFIVISDLGDAQIAVDYEFPPGVFPLEMLPNDTVVIIPITVFDDGLPEGLESLGWEIAYLAGVESGVINLTSAITDEYDVEILSASDTIQWCRYAPLELTASSNAEIHWSPTFAFDNPVGAEVTVRPFLSGWYFATVGSDTCGAIDSIYLDLAIAEIQGPDTIYICLAAQGAPLIGELQGLATDFTWIPSDSTLSDPSMLTTIANPTITTTYILQSDFGVCIASDTVVIRVDSLPDDQHIDIAPLKAYYCAGEIVALFSPSYDSLDFPDIEFQWIPNNGTFETDLTLLNAALQLQDTTLYIRENTNNACSSSDSILINVVPSSVPISVTDTMLCPGEMFNVVILSDQVTEPEWTPTEGLSCDMCLNPTVTVMGVPGSTIVYQFSGMILECPVGASLPIQIPPFQQIDIDGDGVVCVGEMVPLSITNPEGLSGFQWEIVFGDGSLSCTNCPDPVVTINGTGAVNVLLTANTTNPGFCGAQGFIQIIPSQLLQPINISGDNIVCPGDMVPLTITNPAGLSDFAWTVTSGNASLSCTNCPDPVVTINGADSVTVVVTSNTNDVNFCGAEGTFVFHEGERPQVIGPAFLACLGDTVTVSTGSLEYTNIEWSVIGGADLDLSCTNCPFPVVTVNGIGNLRFLADSPDPDVCGVSGTVEVGTFVVDESDLTIIPDFTTTPIGQGTEVMAVLTTTPQFTGNVMWIINGVSIAATGGTISFNAEEEINFVEAKFINSKGCEQIITTSFPTDPPSYMIPNAFTPDNNDELNDNFKIIITGNIVVEEFLIFNRWGQMVYKAAEDSLSGWDGTWNNEPAASDTYVYTATLRYPDGRSEALKGDVMLLR